MLFLWLPRSMIPERRCKSPEEKGASARSCDDIVLFEETNVADIASVHCKNVQWSANQA